MLGCPTEYSSDLWRAYWAKLLNEETKQHDESEYEF